LFFTSSLRCQRYFAAPGEKYAGKGRLRWQIPFEKRAKSAHVQQLPSLGTAFLAKRDLRFLLDNRFRIGYT